VILPPSVFPGLGYGVRIQLKIQLGRLTLKVEVRLGISPLGLLKRLVKCQVDEIMRHHFQLEADIMKHSVWHLWSVL
jgi:hypothetical protein